MNIFFNDNTGINTFFPVDEDGYLKPVVKEYIQIPPTSKAILKEVIEELQVLFGETLLCVYFRGSNLIFSKKSDFDIVVVLNNNSPKESSQLSLHLTGKFNNKYPDIERFDALLLSVEDIQQSRYLQFIIKVLSFRVFGNDIETNLKGFKISNEIQFLIPQIDEKIDLIKRNISNKKLYSIFLSSHLIKFFIRAAFELVLLRANIYTRNIYVCKEQYLKYYPENYSLIEELIQFYQKPINDRDRFTERILEFAAIIKQESTTKSRK